MTNLIGVVGILSVLTSGILLAGNVLEVQLKESASPIPSKCPVCFTRCITYDEETGFACFECGYEFENEDR